MCSMIFIGKDGVFESASEVVNSVVEVHNCIKRKTVCFANCASNAMSLASTANVKVLSNSILKGATADNTASTE